MREYMYSYQIVKFQADSNIGVGFLLVRDAGKRVFSVVSAPAKPFFFFLILKNVEKKIGLTRFLPVCITKKK